MGITVGNRAMRGSTGISSIVFLGVSAEGDQFVLPIRAFVLAH